MVVQECRNSRRRGTRAAQQAQTRRRRDESRRCRQECLRHKKRDCRGRLCGSQCLPSPNKALRYNERRKFRTSCFWEVLSEWKWSTTVFASDDTQPLSRPPRRPQLVACASTVCNRSEVRPSCRKNSRCPTPQSGAVRNSSPPAAPCVTPSARFEPM